MVNPQILQKFKSEQDRIEGKVSEEYETSISQEQDVFDLLLSTISEYVLPRVSFFKHTFEVWDKIHM